MGAAMFGIENVCCLTGDDVTAGDEPEARRVFDLDAIQLIALSRVLKKALAGARFLQLQLCYRTELLERFLRAAHDTGLSERIALIPSICILRSVTGIRFVASNVPGVEVPREVVSRVEQAVDAEAECFEIAYELASHALAQPGVAGLHFISFRRDAGIAKLCGRLGIPPRIERESNGYSASVAL